MLYDLYYEVFGMAVWEYETLLRVCPGDSRPECVCPEGLCPCSKLKCFGDGDVLLSNQFVMDVITVGNYHSTP